MFLIVSKSKIMMFKKGRDRNSERRWRWEAEELEEVKEFRYLGFMLSKNGSHDRQIKQVWSIAERKFKANFKIRMMLFDSLVLGVMMYGAEIWG